VNESADAAQADLFAHAERRRDRGIQRALSHAEETAQNWNRDADRLLRDYLSSMNGAQFLTEQFVAFTAGKIVRPPDGRAWGGVIQRAAAAHHIVKVGYGPAATSNCSPKCLWRERRV